MDTPRTDAIRSGFAAKADGKWIYPEVTGPRLIRQIVEELEAMERELAEARKELELMRELAANPHYIKKVREVMGPLSLWSKAGMEAHVKAAVDAALSQSRNDKPHIGESIRAEG